ncbi:MAG: sensor domain-containing diguanylate cyclase [Endomicrobium sp.]|jgi:diguanylate cyclase (GGDEF)-like protein|nr:sensor domain-containing diguanylate cyclase [Endomicrobium sp.]
MSKNRISKNTIDIISDSLVPIASGIFFIFWAVNLLKHPVAYFPIIAFPIIIFYYFSGSIFSAILVFISIMTGILESLFFIDRYSEICALLFECLAIFGVYAVLELYRKRHVNVRNKFISKYEDLSRKISEKESIILENNILSSNLSGQIKNFRKIGDILQTFHDSLSEKEIVHKSEDIAFRFFSKGSWKLKKYSEYDKITYYIKQNSVPLIVGNIVEDKRFNNYNSEKMSLIAVPIEFNGIFWGILEGYSREENFFSQENLQQLSMISGIIATALNNFYLYKKLQTLAITDGLTSLYTNAYFKERLGEELNRSRSNKIPLSLGILDIDHFKNVNDKYGHQSGDFVLRRIASILRLNFRESDFIARYGGEEFAFMMLHASSKEASKILEKIRASVEHEDFFIPVESLLPVCLKITVSIGFVSLSDKVESSEEEFLKNADKALYKAKILGRNRVEEYLYE